jgi:hypothetical protein
VLHLKKVVGQELERAAAAVLHASGWFLLRGATDPTHQAFEIDVLGYRFDGGTEASIALESKGGKSGFGDLWKLNGLKTHLEIERGVLLADSTDPLHDLKVRYAKKNNIEVIAQEPATLASEIARVEVIDSEPQPDVLAAWVRCLRVEDGLVKTLNDRTLWQQYDTIKLAKEQLQHLVTRGWMEHDPWRQAVKLYELYQEETKIARRMAEEINGSGWGFLMKEALYHGASREIQACLYLEHRKRLAVAFAATRCAALGDDSSAWARLAPASFHAMVETIADEETWYLPAALQVYFLGFGAMICTDDVPQELEFIARQAGCTPNDVNRALALFAELFPFPSAGGWYYNGWDLSRLKLVPVPLRAASVWMREATYGNDWETLATEDQLKIVGRNEIVRAVETEQTVLPRKRRRLRGQRT